MTGITLKVKFVKFGWICIALNKRLTCSAFWVLSSAGISWSVVESPSSENGIMHVSVGVDVVWCVTKDRKVRGLMFCLCFFLPFPCLLLSNRSVTCTGSSGDLDSIPMVWGILVPLAVMGLLCGL